MPDRIVYLVETLPDDSADWPSELVDGEGLAALLAAGWETSTTIQGRKAKHGRKAIPADMMILKKASENRGVSVVEAEPARRGQVMVVQTDAFGMTRELTLEQATTQALQDVSRALALTGQHPGHLGAPGNHNFPGVTVISGELVAKALDIGMQAGFNGASVDTCPFPPGNPARNQWMKGWDVGNKKHVAPDVATPEMVTQAEQEGHDTALAYGKDVEVQCPHRIPAMREGWLRGFERGGGTVLPPPPPGGG